MATDPSQGKHWLVPHAADIPGMAAEIVRRQQAPAGPDATTPERIQNLAGLLRRMRDLADHIVSGRRALDRWEVRFAKFHRAASIVLAMLGGAGLVTLKVGPERFEGVTWVAFLGGLGALAINIGLELYKAFGVEKTAVQATAVNDAILLLRRNVEAGLRNRDPRDTLEPLLQEADGLARTYRDVLAEAPAADVDALFFAWVARYHEDWGLMRTPQPKPRGMRP